MMDVEKFGGIAVAIMLHKTDFEIAVADMDAALNLMSGKLHKLMHGDLRKRAGFVDLQAELNDILSDLAKLQEIADRRRAALPDFESFISNKPFVKKGTGIVRDDGRRFLLTDKDGTAEVLPMAQKPQVDPTEAVTDTMLNRRFNK
jgi:hypothetical protein